MFMLRRPIKGLGRSAIPCAKHDAKQYKGGHFKGGVNSHQRNKPANCCAKTSKGDQFMEITGRPPLEFQRKARLASGAALAGQLKPQHCLSQSSGLKEEVQHYDRSEPTGGVQDSSQQRWVGDPWLQFQGVTTMRDDATG